MAKNVQKLHRTFKMDDLLLSLKYGSIRWLIFSQGILDEPTKLRENQRWGLLLWKLLEGGPPVRHNQSWDPYQMSI